MHTRTPGVELRCVDCDYPLMGLQSSTCPECGRAFDRDDLASVRVDIDDPVQVAAVLVPAAAEALQSLLFEHDVVAEVVHVPVTMVEPAKSLVRVARSQEGEARRIIETKTDEASWTCADCGEAVEGQFQQCWQCGSERPT